MENEAFSFQFLGYNSNKEVKFSVVPNQYTVFQWEVRFSNAREGRTWIIDKRYSDFLHLHEMVKEKFSLEFANFPPKQIWQRLADSVVDKRRNAFQVFLMWVGSFSRVINSLPFREFIEFHENVVDVATQDITGARNNFPKVLPLLIRRGRLLSNYRFAEAMADYVSAIQLSLSLEATGKEYKGIHDHQNECVQLLVELEKQEAIKANDAVSCNSHNVDIYTPIHRAIEQREIYEKDYKFNQEPEFEEPTALDENIEQPIIPSKEENGVDKGDEEDDNFQPVDLSDGSTDQNGTNGVHEEQVFTPDFEVVPASPNKKGPFWDYRITLQRLRSTAKDKITEKQRPEEIMKYLTDSIRGILQCILDDCLKELPPATTKWMIFGMGDMAREQMGLYGPIKFGIILKDKNKGTMTWGMKLSELFANKIFVLGETIFTVDGFTMYRCPKGISLDQYSNPLREPFLIGDISEVLEWQNIARYNHQKKLSKMLRQTCYLYGDKHMWDTYNSAVNSKLQQTIQYRESVIPLCKNRALYNLRGLVLRWNVPEPTFNHIWLDQLLDFLQEIVEGLALYHGIFQAHTTLGKIRLLGKRRAISPKGAENLAACFNIMLEMKLKLHAFYKEEGTEIYFEREASDFSKQGDKQVGIKFKPLNEETNSSKKYWMQAEDFESLRQIYHTIDPTMRIIKAWCHGHLEDNTPVPLTEHELQDDSLIVDGLLYLHIGQPTMATQVVEAFIAQKGRTLRALRFMGILEILSEGPNLYKAKQFFDECLDSNKAVYRSKETPENYGEVAQDLEWLTKMHIGFGEHTRAWEAISQAMRMNSGLALGEGYAEGLIAYDKVVMAQQRFSSNHFNDCVRWLEEAADNVLNRFGYCPLLLLIYTRLAQTSKETQQIGRRIQFVKRVLEIKTLLFGIQEADIETQQLLSEPDVRDMAALWLTMLPVGETMYSNSRQRGFWEKDEECMLM